MDPVDITAPGVYELEAPVAEAAHGAPQAVVLPPDIIDYFIVERVEPPEIVRRDGRQLVTVSMLVTDVQAPYSALRAWVH
jgi:hypothetical protein